MFYYLCYEGSVDLDQVNDLAARHALEVQISEFGQIPKQLFVQPHVTRLAETKNEPKANEPHEMNLAALNDCGKCTRAEDHSKSIENMCSDVAMDLTEFTVYDVIKTHKDVITCIQLCNNTIVSTGKDGLLKCYSLADKRQLRYSY